MSVRQGLVNLVVISCSLLHVDPSKNVPEVARKLSEQHLVLGLQ